MIVLALIALFSLLGVFGLGYSAAHLECHRSNRKAMGR